jgi:small subunit ribosomal protein S4
MAVNRTPVLKRCRSLDLDPVYLGIDKKSRRKAKNAGRKISEYGLQLREKQKAKFIYGVLEKPFRNYYKKAEKQKGMTGENLMIMLELRLDNVVYRLGLARTRKEARQIVDHKHILVNGKCVNIPSYLVKAGDVIEVREKSKSSARYKEVLETTNGRLVPEWLEADKEALSIFHTRDSLDKQGAQQDQDDAQHVAYKAYPCCIREECACEKSNNRKFCAAGHKCCQHGG